MVLVTQKLAVCSSLNSNVYEHPLPTINLYLDSLEYFRRKISLHEKRAWVLE